MTYIIIISVLMAAAAIVAAAKPGKADNLVNYDYKEDTSK